MVCGYYCSVITSGNDYVGIFIGAPAISKPPNERTNAFSDSFRRAAERFGYVAMTTWDLYCALDLIEGGKLQADEFWRSVFQTKGIFKLREGGS